MRLSLPEGITRTIAKQVLVAKKNSPHIFFGAGILGAIGSTVLACRATLKLEETLDEIKTDIEKVKVAEHLSKEEYYRLMTLKAGRGAIKITRLYLPSAVVGAAALAALANSHAELNRRNHALSGALAVMSQAFEEYRERVREEVGDEKERDIYYGVTEKHIEIDGKKQLVRVIDKDGFSPFARVFDANSWRWENNPEINRMIILAQEAYMQDKLNRYGYVLLNEAYEVLGLERSSEGAIYGWIRSKPNEPTKLISFGLDKFPQNIHFIKGQENHVVLDFNVDGIIYDMIDKL